MLMDSTYRLVACKLKADTTNSNLMGNFFQHYSNGGNCCKYMITFERNNIVRSYYYTYDTLNYSATGEWKLLEKDVVFLKLDKYVNGIFDVKEEGKDILLSCDSNALAIFNNAKMSVVLTVKKE